MGVRRVSSRARLRRLVGGLDAFPALALEFAGGEKVYVAGDVASTFHPTGTTLAVSYRQLHQPQQTLVPAEYRSERMNVHLAQALHLPLDLKLLLGFEVARAANSPLGPSWSGFPTSPP